MGHRAGSVGSGPGPGVASQRNDRRSTRHRRRSAKLVANPVQFDEKPVQLKRAPQFAEHTDDILRALGKSDDELIDLKVSGAVT